MYLESNLKLHGPTTGAKMVDEDGDTASSTRCPSHRHRDSVSSLPDEILHHILSYLPTELVIRTSILSKRWRHVWSHTPSLSFSRVPPEPINKTLALYKALKMTSFQLSSSISNTGPYIDGWIKLVMSKNVENISLDLGLVTVHAYYIPDFFYISSSVKQISVELHGLSYLRRPRCSVSWPSLKKLSLYYCKLSPEFIAIISSGCPILESLTLHSFNHMKILDLRKLQLLRILDIDSSIRYPGPMQILAPQIRCLRLKKNKFPCTLVDVSSLVEAALDINFYSDEMEIKLKGNCLEGLMLKKLKNVEKLSFGANFLKVKDLTLETMVSKYVVPGLERVLQNSLELKKLTLHITDSDTLMEQPIDKFLDLRAARRLSKGYVDNICWSSEARVFENISYQNLEIKHVASFMELILKNTKTLEKMVVRLKGYTEGREFDELREMVSMLSHNNNVHIVVSSTKPNQRV